MWDALTMGKGAWRGAACLTALPPVAWAAPTKSLSDDTAAVRRYGRDMPVRQCTQHACMPPLEDLPCMQPRSHAPVSRLTGSAGVVSVMLTGLLCGLLCGLLSGLLSACMP